MAEMSVTINDTLEILLEQKKYNAIKTVLSTMNYTNMGNFVTALALGIILFALSLLINIAVSILQGRLAK